jgi:phosphocarrier protein HPr
VPATVTSAAGREVDAASILGILTLGAGHGQEVTVASESAEAVAVLAAMLERDLDLE